MLKRAALSVAAVLMAVTWPGPAPAAQQVDNDPVRARVEAVTGRFIARVRACGVTPAFLPTVAIESGVSLISYDYDRRTMIVSRWAELPEPVQGFMAAWAAQGTMSLAAEQHFGEVFNDLLVAHELGHWLAHLSGGWRFGADLWAGEVEANRIAIAFLLVEGDEATAERRIANFTTFLGSLPSPVPDGTSPAAHFNQNYQALGQDPAAYGWYQGAFMRTAWEERGATDFCQLVRRNTATVAPAP